MSPSHHDHPPKKLSEEDMIAQKIPIWCRDSCVDLLPALNACRKETYYMPWKCEHERHIYEKCQYEE
jgi:NADH dehydrogenase (ubiquinone) 1 beta subcomplex subunit 7